MTKRFIVLTAMASCVLIGAFLNALFARDESPSNWKTLERAYAQANLELAQARLAQAKSQNQTVKGSVSQGMMDELSAGVQITQDYLRQLDGKGTGNPFAPQIVAAEDAVRGLEANHAESIKANTIQAGTVTDAELRRELAEIAVAKARVAALKVVSQQSPEVRIQWEIGQLQDQIRALWARPLIED